MTTTETETVAPTARDRIRAARARVARAWAHPRAVAARAAFLTWASQAWASPASLARTVFWVVAGIVAWRVGTSAVEAVQGVVTVVQDMSTGIRNLFGL